MENSKIDNFLEMLDGILTHSKENPNMVNELLLNAANKKDNKKRRCLTPPYYVLFQF